MCGITGFVQFNRQPPIAMPRLRYMVESLHHRGPDEDGLAIHGSVAMGMRRLSIIDLSGGQQPIYNEDRTVWTVYNGEIYNFPELRRKLSAKVRGTLRKLGYPLGQPESLSEMLAA